MVARISTLFALSLLVLHAGCGRTELQRTEERFRVEPDLVDFGKVLEREQRTQTVSVISTGRASVALTFEASPPFTVSPQETLLPGGGSASIELTFQSEAGDAEGALSVRSAAQTQTVTLKGRGVRPLACQPSQACRESRFDLEAEACVEAVSVDGSACVPADLCLEQGVCLEGTCLGVPRNCDDGNLCTQDACSAEVGCVNTPVVCPPPSRACHLSVCRPSTGCGEVTAQDGTICGVVDPSCDFADLCKQGTCERILPAPDGLTCAAPTPCRPAGTCQAAECEQEPATPMVPAFSQPLPAPVRLDETGRTKLVETSGGVALELCGLPIEAGEETYFPDGGVRPQCALASYTSAGFERFVRAYDDAAPRALTASQGGSILVTGESTLESYSLSTGEPRWTADLTAAARPSGTENATPILSSKRVAVSSQDALWLTIGYEENGSTLPNQTLVHLGPDGGTLLEEDVSALGTGGAIALAEDEQAVWLATPSGRYGRIALTSDAGGVSVESAEEVGADSSRGGVALVGGSVLIGDQTQVFAPTDGGTPVVAAQLALAAGERVDGMGPLLSRGEGVRFVRACPGGSPGCTAAEEGVYAHRFKLAGPEGWTEAGAVGARIELGRPGTASTLEAAALLRSGDLCAVTQTAEGGFASLLTAHRDSLPLFSCELAEGRQVRGARYGNGRLFVVIEQPEGGFVLEGYRLDGVQLEASGWSVPDGVGGAQRPRPRGGATE